MRNIDSPEQLSPTQSAVAHCTLRVARCMARTQARLHTHTYTRPNTRTCRRTDTRTRTCACAQARTHTHRRPRAVRPFNAQRKCDRVRAGLQAARVQRLDVVEALQRTAHATLQRRHGLTMQPRNAPTVQRCTMAEPCNTQPLQLHRCEVAAPFGVARSNMRLTDRCAPTVGFALELNALPQRAMTAAVSSALTGRAVLE